MTLPAVPATFHWTDETWGPALRCHPLDAIAPHLFTTRQLALSDAASVTAMAAAIGAREAVLLHQVHGRDVVIVRDDEATIGQRQGDVLVSDANGVAIAVKAADCVPLLMADTRTGAVAAVHAGWRGTAARAAVAAVETMAGEFGTRPEDLIVAVGPSIGPCCYEVGTELVDAFAAAGHERSLIDRWFLAQPPPRGPYRHTLGAAQQPRLRLDVPGANRDQLILAGVLEEHIHLAGLCTAEHLDVLTSYRVEKTNAGRIAGVITRRPRP